MTSRAPGDEELSPLHERVTRARRSVVAIRAGALVATGWVALPNGVVITSRRAIGYPADLGLELDDGTAIAGRVVSADVARDVALILPLEIPSIPPLPLRPRPEPRLGEPVFALSCMPGQSLRLASGRVCQIRRGADAPPAFEIDALAPPGAPVLDLEGRVLGLVTTGAAARPCAIAIGALQTLLGAADRPVLELRDRSPVYRCPACDDPFDVEADRCLACGRPLPHGFAAPPALAAAERFVRQSLASLGVAANRVRVGPRSWRIAQRPFSTAEATQVELEVDEPGRHLVLRAPVVGLPAANHEPFYRFLLTMNDQTTGAFRVSVNGDLVSISCVEPIPSGRDGASAFATIDAQADHGAAALIDEIVRIADEYRRTLVETFDAIPRRDAPPVSLPRSPA